MSTRFFTNEGDNTLLEKFRAVFSNNPHITEFDALVGYFHSAGYFRLRPHLDKLHQIRVLVGINVDEITAKTQRKGLALPFGAGSDQIQADYRQQFQEEIDGADYNLSTEQSILQFVADIESQKIVIKAHPSRNLHAKIYIFRPQEFNEHSSGEVITGSSNLTAAGLGTDNTYSNYEFNVSLRDYDDIKFATNEFDKLWKESVEVLPAEITKARNETYLRDDFTSSEIYYKLLIEYFDKEIEFDPNSISDLPVGYLRLNYQMDAVEQGHILLQEHNGFFLSDVVGLGKTVIATLIARKYFYFNGYPEYRSHTLIVCPPAVKTIWMETVNEFQLDNVTLITTGSLHQITDQRKYDLVIVDEAHKFRNDTSLSYALLQSICKSKCRDGKKKRVILVSATPLNNRPNDIKNQLLLFQDANDSSLEVNITRFFNEASIQYQNLISQDIGSEIQTSIEDIFARIRRRVIEPLTVRRTRTDLTEHTLYADDLRRQGIVFPEVRSPINLLYQLNPKINQCYEQTIHRILNINNNGLQYARYRLIEFLKPEHKQDYQSPEQITAQLASIMMTLLIKRLDSSFHAFHQSLIRFVRASEMVLEMVAGNRIFIAPDVDLQEYIEQGREEELLEKLATEQQTDPRIKILTQDDFEPGLFELLEQDHEQLQEMEYQWGTIVNDYPDPKLQLLFDELPGTLLNEVDNPEQKLIIFSESADTIDYLSAKLVDVNYRVLSISARNRTQQQNTIRHNFDANLRVEEQYNEYDILVATESLAEGVNLHRANIIVNYDTPWNATRLMQRIGRINRIGSRADFIHIYNFFPTDQVEGTIGLKRRAQIKLQAFHSALGEDSQIYSRDEEVQTFGLFDQNIIEDIDINERLVYLMEIRKFRMDKPDEFKRIKNLPLKIRNAVTDDERSGSTLCFLRNRKHNAFYKVDVGNNLEELGFLEAAPVFKQHCDCLTIWPLPDTHYVQVQHALGHFEEQVLAKIITEQQTPELTNQQKTAIRYLRAFLKLDITLDYEKQRIEQTLEWVTLGRSQNLTRDIARLQNSQKRNPVIPSKQLEALVEIIARHAPDIGSVGDDDTADDSYVIEPPKIVISQSCITP